MSMNPAGEDSAVGQLGGPATDEALPRAMLSPAKVFRVGLALLRGYWYKGWYALRRKRFSAGRNFRVFGSMHVGGPGEVVFGDDVVVLGHVTPWTHSRAARIVVGDRVMLGDARFGCMQEITVGSDSLLARCSIMDTDFHSVRADRRFPDAPVRVIPVHIGENVWVGQEAGILPGARIGANSVVSFGAVCVREYPPNVVIIGNPGKVAMQIPIEGRERVPYGRAPAAVSDVSPPATADMSPVTGRPAIRTTLGAAFLFVSLLACGDSRVETVSQMASTSAIENSSIDQLRKTKVFFGHQSVGANILEGIQDLGKQDQRFRLEVTRAERPSAVPRPALVEAIIGRNSDPQSKADSFVEALRGGLGPDGGIALYKYCYLDVRPDTNVDQLFESYQRAVQTVRAGHPEITIVHVTIPLTADEGAVRRLARVALRKPGGRELNVKRNAFNERLRDTFSASEPVFDLARVESTRSDGSRTYFRAGGKPVYTLAAEYTDDGGHLNQLGRVTAARELVRVLSAAAARRGERISASASPM